MEHSAGRMRGSVWIEHNETLQLLFEINERGLHLMAQAIELPGAGESNGPRAVFGNQLRDVWRNTDAAALARAACFPTLLLDIRGWDTAPATDDPRGFFPDLCAVPLMRSTLTLAWHVCRTDRQTAGLLLGLPAPSVSSISQLRLQDLERIALTRAHCLRPRWSTLPSMWTELLMAARAGTARACGEFRLRALQKMIGELLPVQS